MNDQTYDDGVRAAIRVLKARHFTRRIDVRTTQCRLFHDHDAITDPGPGYSCYTEGGICAGCGTELCNVLPLVEALLPEAGQ